MHQVFAIYHCIANTIPFCQLSSTVWLDLLTKPNNWVSSCVQLPTNMADFFDFYWKIALWNIWQIPATTLQVMTPVTARAAVMERPVFGGQEWEWPLQLEQWNMPHPLSKTRNKICNKYKNPLTTNNTGLNADLLVLMGCCIVEFSSCYLIYHLD